MEKMISATAKIQTEKATSSSLDYFKRIGSPIVAPATALGGPVSIVRISGRNLSFLEQIMGSLPAPGTFALKKIADPQSPATSLIDRALVLYFQSPHSFTGEDVVEIQCHGVPSIIERICELACSLGARTALPGEFSFRALANDKMTLQEAESLNSALSLDNISVEVAAELVGAHGKHTSRISELLVGAVRSIETARGRAEAAIDFPEAEAEQSADLEQAKNLLLNVSGRLAELLSYYDIFCDRFAEPRIAIVGPTNAGKSTLFNILCGGERAIVSPLAGTTRDLIETRMRLPSGRWVRLMDTAGVRTFSNGQPLVDHELVESLGIQLGQEAAKHAQIVIQIQNLAQTITPLEESKESSANFINVYSHKDLAKDNSLAGAFDFLHESLQLRAWLLDQIETLIREQAKQTSPSQDAGLISGRQQKLISLSAAEIKMAESALGGQLPIELTALHLREAESLLKKAIGTDAGDEYIGQIFSQFCLGK
ncbi:MAG: 50S ribosome-binding GTPase [Bdellovibrionales bacterium]|nr:50S ribosome-binding GTPase [Bdellovibrionales bacterium]